MRALRAITRRLRRIRYSRWLILPLRLSRVPAPTDTERADRHFLPAGYRERGEPEYFDDESEPGIEYQPDVYRKAARLARSVGATTIVDVGCGRARKLAALHPEFELIGLDFGNNIEHCRQAYPFGTWVEHDLDREDSLLVDQDVLAESVVVCADVVEHVGRPQRALRALRATFPPAHAILISTPDRIRINLGRPLGPPFNEAHVREWTRSEFANLLRWCGFERGYLTYTRPFIGASELTTILYVLRDSASLRAPAVRTAALLP